MLSMGRLSQALLYFRLIKELFRYDAVRAMRGFQGVRGRLPPRVSRGQSISPELEAAVCEALVNVVPFYWKRVLCLQRSVVTARVLRTYGARADVVIGYRLAPFLSHAWVEVGGRVVNDSPSYQRRLQVLERF
jgi:hypothetical protein